MEIPMILLAALPWLFILACPLVMWWMMRSMGCDKQPSAEGAGEGSRADAEEIRLLKQRIADLETARQDARSFR